MYSIDSFKLHFFSFFKFPFCLADRAIAIYHVLLANTEHGSQISSDNKKEMFSVRLVYDVAIERITEPVMVGLRMD